MNGTYEEEGSFEENSNYKVSYSQKETIVISRTRNKERRLEKIILSGLIVKARGTWRNKIDTNLFETLDKTMINRDAKETNERTLGRAIIQHILSFYNK